MPAIVLSPSRQ